jgi:hypothetical protein
MSHLFYAYKSCFCLLCSYQSFCDLTDLSVFRTSFSALNQSNSRPSCSNQSSDLFSSWLGSGLDCSDSATSANISWSPYPDSGICSSNVLSKGRSSFKDALRLLSMVRSLASSQFVLGVSPLLWPVEATVPPHILCDLSFSLCMLNLATTVARCNTPQQHTNFPDIRLVWCGIWCVKIEVIKGDPWLLWALSRTRRIFFRWTACERV